eukprot:6791840-Pyramimonas_sp.AAC.1
MSFSFLAPTASSCSNSPFDSTLSVPSLPEAHPRSRMRRSERSREGALGIDAAALCSSCPTSPLGAGGLRRFLTHPHPSPLGGG